MYSGDGFLACVLLAPEGEGYLSLWSERQHSSGGGSRLSTWSKRQHSWSKWEFFFCVERGARWDTHSAGSVAGSVPT